VTLDELKIMQLTNQHLLAKTDCLTAARDLCGFQAQFYGNAFHCARIRCAGPMEEQAWGCGLLKSWTVRGTVHVFAESDLPLFIRRRLPPAQVCESGWYPFLEKNGYHVAPERNAYFAELIVDSIAQGKGEREHLRALCRGHGMTEGEERHVFNQWGGTFAALAGLGIIAYKVTKTKEYVLCEPFAPMDEEAAYTEITRRYFTHFGPATLRDCSYFLHQPQMKLRGWLEGLPYHSFKLENKTYFYIKSGHTYAYDMPKCLFLAGFDQLMLGYEKKDSIYLRPQHLRGIFNVNGIVFPALLVDGEVVGRWKEGKKGITVTLFTELTAAQKNSILDRTEELWPGYTAALEQMKEAG